MNTKKKKQASSQQGQKSSAGSTTQSKSPGRIKLKSKHKAKEESAAKITSSSLIPFTKYGIGYTSLVLIIGMYFISERYCSFLPS